MDDTDRDVEGLISLPGVVLSRIFMYVDDSDIPTLQQTCQTLRSVIMTQQFWHNRIHRLCEEHVVSPPEEELEEYSIAELKQWTMRRIRARSISPVELQLRSQDSPTIGFYGDIFLVPGGRWLLNFYYDLRVYFVDLDNSNLEMRLLLDPRNVDPRISQYQAIGNRIWIDHKAPRLSFRFEGSLADTEGDSKFTWVYIYQVDLVGHGTGATLVARNIATFRTPGENSPHGLHALNNRYFVQDRGYNSIPVQGVNISDYRQALGCFDYPLMECHTSPSEFYSSEMEFINKDVLAIRGRSTPSYYTPDIESSTSFYYILEIESSTSFKVLHKIEIPQVSAIFSRTCWTSKASLMTFVSYPTFCDARVLHGLVIPHDSRFHPWMVELGNFVGEERLSINFKLGIFISLHCNSRKDTISRFCHEWDHTYALPRVGPAAYISILKQDVEHPETLIAFDEDTGRSVYLDDGKLDVVDIVIAG